MPFPFAFLLSQLSLTTGRDPVLSWGAFVLGQPSGLLHTEGSGQLGHTSGVP